MLEPDLCSRFRLLEYSITKDQKWYKEITSLTGLNEYVLSNKRPLLKAFKPEWGIVEFKQLTYRSQITWHRPDGGPVMILSSDRSVEELIIKVMLKALLIKKLESQQFLGFVKTGFPKQWNHCSIFVDDRKMEQVVWACALTGICMILDTNAKSKTTPTKQVNGNVAIYVNKEPQTLF